tara:strand:- start:81680 stop:82270 length:591 start_codon:yes stop_codon:yes gene_type:complete
MIRLNLTRTIAAFTLIAIAVSGCASPPAPKFPDLRFTHMPKITLDVASIEIVDNFQSAGAAHIEDRMPVSPETALRNWAQDRLEAGGVSGVAKFIINSAAVSETKLTKKGGITGAFTTQQSHRYDADLRVELRLEGVPRVSKAFAEANVTRSQTIGEDASINVREQMWFDLTESLMKDYDPLMSNSIRTHLSDLIR